MELALIFQCVVNWSNYFMSPAKKCISTYSIYNLFGNTFFSIDLYFPLGDVYLRFKSKQLIDTAGLCWIWADLDRPEAELWRIRPFSSYFCLSNPAFCSSKIPLCSSKKKMCTKNNCLSRWKYSCQTWKLVIRKNSLPGKK